MDPTTSPNNSQVLNANTPEQEVEENQAQQDDFEQSLQPANYIYHTPENQQATANNPQIYYSLGLLSGGLIFGMNLWMGKEGLTNGLAYGEALYLRFYGTSIHLSRQAERKRKKTLCESQIKVSSNPVLIV